MLQLHILKCLSFSFLPLAGIPENASSYTDFCVSHVQVVCTDTWKRGSHCKPGLGKGYFPHSLPLNLESQPLLCKRRNLECWGAELLKALSYSHLRDQQGLKYFETNLQIRVLIAMLLCKLKPLVSIRHCQEQTQKFVWMKSYNVIITQLLYFLITSFWALSILLEHSNSNPFTHSICLKQFALWLGEHRTTTWSHLLQVRY